MRGALGPILTTGVALTAAGVVVANPVIPPRSDVQIPAIQLSAGSGDALGMLDEDFLNAIAPAPPQSTNPFVIIKDLITSLAADATYLGTNAIVDAFVAGATAVTQPELTALSVPYIPNPPYPDFEGTVAALGPVSPLSEPLEALAAPELVLPAGGVADLTPVVAEVVHAVVSDVSYVGHQLVTAAFAAGAVLAAEPGLIVDTLRALVNGDVREALETAVKVVVAPLGPPRMILDALRTVVEQRLPAFPAVELPVFAMPAPKTPGPGSSLAAHPIAPNTGPVLNAGATLNDGAAVDGTERKPDGVEAPLGASRPSVGSILDDGVSTADGLAAQAPAADGSSTAATTAAGGTDLSDGNKSVPTRPIRRSGRLGAGQAGDALAAVGDQVQTALQNVGDAAGNVTGKLTGRTARTASGSDSGR